ncbi:O-methyltransferase MdmC [Aplysia californica]|uniref:O-methyltransferase MdmC n=1 Tax=Aplysia californica TaxID=6500 RepID=A0ABM1A6Y9_APLCA|nr:O-methyltransferase MdmC [Aplysia californica]
MSSKPVHILSLSDPTVLELQRALKLAQNTGASPDVIKSIKMALELVDLREKYTDSVTSGETEVCQKILAETYKHDWKRLHADGKIKVDLSPVMMTGKLEGQFLKSMVSIQKAKRVLDIGMFTGYSALSMAEALPADGELVTLDFDKYLETFTGSLLRESPHAKKIQIFIGSLSDYMKDTVKAGKSFDLIFMDADRSYYPEYLKIIFEEGLLAPRGTVLMDNAFGYGCAYMPSVEDNPTRKVGDLLMADPSLHKVVVPLRDGVVMLRRKADVDGQVPQ